VYIHKKERKKEGEMRKQEDKKYESTQENK
jgi:hypothetical protein